MGEIPVREREDRIESDISPMHVSTTVDDRSGRPDDYQANKKTQNQLKRNTIRNRATRCVPRIPVWLQEFRENLVDGEIPLHGGSHASSSHEVPSEPVVKRREDLGKHKC